MTDDSIRWLADQPELVDPVLIVMLTGWIDAGGAARAAGDAIQHEGATAPIVEFDDDTYAVSYTHLTLPTIYSV